MVYPEIGEKWPKMGRFPPKFTIKARGGGGGNLTFQDTGLCHSNRKNATHKSGDISQKYTHKSGEFSENHTHKSGKCEKSLKTIPINPEST